ncbi:MAG: hypothetical protein FJ090_03055 [Deltaproteobacteria bacterium]|nr:hypothetical protein [Deltaproteobacteria bacterium]
MTSFLAIHGLFGLVGCEDAPRVPQHFDGPVAAAVIPADGRTPFSGPIGFVANSRSGTIVPLDLEEGRILTDDPTASFLRASAVATGQSRQLRDLAAFVLGGDDGRGEVWLWALDASRDQLVAAPYLTGAGDDGSPVEVAPEATEATFVDADGSGDSATLSGLVLREGYTTTEDWSIEYDGSRWWAVGSRSGTQETEPVGGTSFKSDFGEVEFLIEGEATAGDRFEFATDTGLREFSLSGRPTAILGGDGVLWVSVEGEAPAVHGLDPASGATLVTVALPAGAAPWRLAASDDGRLFVADSRSPGVYVLSEGALVETIVTAGAVVDVAWQAGDDASGTPFERLFVAPLGARRVDVYDLATGQWVDPNPADAPVEGVDLGSPISGLAASAGTVWLQQPNAWGATPRVPTVVAATQDGFVFQIDAGTGCAVTSLRGPHGPNEIIDSSDAYAYAVLEDQGPASDAELSVDDSTGEQVAVSSCGGVARGEAWTVTYDSASVSWIVEGSFSGEQQGRAYTDERYLSDTGAISFFIVGGTLPPTDGDRFGFEVDRGLLVISGIDHDEDGLIGAADDPLDFPARPLAYEDIVGPSGGGWDATDRREYALVMAENQDVVARCLLDAGVAQTGWE